MEHELRVPWEDVFASIEPHPMAAGTIAQVHRAILVERRACRGQGAAPERRGGHPGRPRAARAAGRQGGRAQGVHRGGRRAGHHRPPVLLAAPGARLPPRGSATWSECATVLAPFDRLDVPRVYARADHLAAARDGGGAGRSRSTTLPPGEARTRGGPAAARGLLPAGADRRLLPRRSAPGEHAVGRTRRSTCSTWGWWARWTPSSGARCCSCCSPSGGEDVAFLAELMLALSAEPVDARGSRTDAFERRARRARRALPPPAAERAPARAAAAAADGDVAAPRRSPARRAGADRQGVRPDAAGRGRARSHTRSVLGRRLVLHAPLSERLRTSADPRRLFFEAQKLRVRADRVLESLERVIGARPGAGLQVEMTRNDQLTAVIDRTGKRITFGLTAAAAAVLGGVRVERGAKGAPVNRIVARLQRAVSSAPARWSW